MSILFFLLLISTPGALVTFGLPTTGLRWHTRLLTGVALSPFVVAALLMLLKAAGLDYAVAARIVLVLAGLGLLLVARGSREVSAEREDALGLVCTALVLAALCGVLWASWSDHPRLQYTTWHALHHTDISYATTNPGVVPRDPGLAGSLIRYPFLAHYFWGWLGWLLDLPPNAVYRWTNTAWVVVTGGLLYDFARRAGVRPALGALAVVLVFSGNNLLAAVQDVQQGAFRPFSEIGDARYSLFLQKFYSFNVLPFGLGLAAALMALCAQMLGERPTRAASAVLALSLVALGTVYPIPFPPVWVGVAVTAGLLVLPVGGRAPAVRGRAAVELVAGLFMATAVSAGFLLFCLAGRDAPAEAWTWERMLLKCRFVAISVGPLCLVALPATWRGVRQRDPRVAFALALFAASVGFYAVVPLASANEYKVVFLATMVAAVLAASSLSGLLADRTGLTLAAVVVALAPLLWLNLERLELLVRPRAAPRLEVDSFHLRLASGERDAEWTAAVREQTPRNTVVIAPAQRLPPSVVTQRDLFVAASRYWIGYEVQPRTMIVAVRGASPEVYRQRLKLQGWLYGRNRRRYDAVYEQLEALGRPVAIRFESDRHPFLAWLRERDRGSALLTGSGSAVWYLDFEGATTSPNT